MADRGGYIGRNPGDSSVIVAKQTFEPTGVQTDFTFSSGYTPGYIDVYLNGSRLIVASDYTATDGSVVGLTSAAGNGDVLECVAYKAFNLGNVTNATGNFTVGGNLTVNGTTTGISSVSYATTSFGLVGGPNINVNNVVAVGYVTATTFYGDGSNLEGIGGGLGTAISDTSGLTNQIYTTGRNDTVSAGTSVTVESGVGGGGIAFTKLARINVGTGATLHVGSGTTLIMDVLGIF